MENLILIDIGGTTIKFGLNTGEKLELLPAKKTPKTLPEFYQCLEETVNELKTSTYQRCSAQLPGGSRSKNRCDRGGQCFTLYSWL